MIFNSWQSYCLTSISVISYHWKNFNKAKELIPGNKIAYIKIKEVEKLEQAAKDQELAQKFNSKMIEAKSSFDDKAYDKAISLYNEAAKIDPSSKSPKERIDEINEHPLINEK